MKRSNGNRRAFTILELVVVLAVFVVLGTLLLPALAQDNKTESRSIRCLANHAELIKAWQLYTADYDDYVANNYTLPGTQSAVSKWKPPGIVDTWAPNIMVYSVTGGDAVSTTNTALAEAALLVRYHKNAGAYRCPSDNFLSRAQKAAGWKYRVRSVSMNSNWGRSDPFESKGGISTSWVYGAAFAQWHKLSEVRKPAERFVFLDEHPDSVNDGFFLDSWGSSAGEYPATSRTAQWGDIPGFYHNNGTPFGFADGHTEMKKWFSRPIPIRADGNFVSGPADLRDQQWYVQHVAEHR